MRRKVQDVFSQTLRACIDRGLLPAVDAVPQIESPRQASHGDWCSTNLAMAIQKQVAKPPRTIAEILTKNLVDPQGIVANVEIAGPGFINIRLTPDVWFRGLEDVLVDPDAFGRSDSGGGERVLVEFVSANPTGPLHVGHGRGGVVGDVLSNLLSNAGYQVTREYYINDAGGQVDVLARSVHIRYQQQFGRSVILGEKMYPGEYVVAIAQRMKEEYGDRLLDAPESEWRGPFSDAAMATVLTGIRSDLEAFGIRFDNWFSERTLHQAQAVEKVISTLTGMGLIYRGTLPPPKGKEIDDYEPREQLLFRSTAFGDDSDRALQKSDGSSTYFSGDLAYHQEKLSRGFHTLINVWGADHVGGVKRLQSAVEALSGRKGTLEILLVQLVNLFRDGQPVRMGKRSGNFVALRDILDEVGRDATRFFFVMRSASTTLDFDLALARKQANDNPVFYVQMGHARIASILRRAAEQGHAAPSFDLQVLRRLTKPEELDLIKRTLAWPDLVAGAAAAREPHRVVFFLQETIAAFHSYYTQGKNQGFRVVSEDRELTQARLLMCRGLQIVLRNALRVLGVSAPEQMIAPEGEEV